MKGSQPCKAKAKVNKKEKVDRVKSEKSEADSETDSVGHIREQVNRTTQEKEEKQVTVEIVLTAMDHGRMCEMQKVEFLVDTGVHKTILCGSDWRQLREQDLTLKPKVCKVRFAAYGASKDLEMQGRTEKKLMNMAGRQVNSIVYIARGRRQSLLGLKDSQALGIVQVNREGTCQDESVNTLQEEQSVEKLEELLEKHSVLFQGVGKVKVDLVHIFMIKLNQSNRNNRK